MTEKLKRAYRKSYFFNNTADLLRLIIEVGMIRVLKWRLAAHYMG
jgi:hypothetical protein